MEPDPEVLRRARRIAERLAVPKPRRVAAAQRGAGELASLPYRAEADEVDIERTVERLMEHPERLAGGLPPAEEDIVVRQRRRERRAVVLLVDVSGSMRGERVRTAAATVGALAAELSRDDLAVVAFWSDAAVLMHLGERGSARWLLESMVRIPARGLTNLAFPLGVAARELAAAPSGEAELVLLLSDCMHNAGPDPRPEAARLPRLDVLLDTAGEHDLDLARDLARAGRGRLMRAAHYRDVAPALQGALTG